MVASEQSESIKSLHMRDNTLSDAFKFPSRRCMCALNVEIMQFQLIVCKLNVHLLRHARKCAAEDEIVPTLRSDPFILLLLLLQLFFHPSTCVFCLRGVCSLAVAAAATFVGKSCKKTIFPS